MQQSRLETPEEEEENSYEFRNLRTIRRFRDQPEALLARNVLESAGIVSFLQDENIVRLVWQNSNLLGGIKLQVASQDVEAAEAILSQPIPESIDVGNKADYEQPKCPKCGSLDCRFNSHNVKAATVSLYLTGIPLPFVGPRDYWHCNQCDTNWVDEGDTLVQA